MFYDQLILVALYQPMNDAVVLSMSVIPVMHYNLFILCSGIWIDSNLLAFDRYL